MFRPAAHSAEVPPSTVHRTAERASRRDFAFPCDPLRGYGVWLVTYGIARLRRRRSNVNHI